MSVCLSVCYRPSADIRRVCDKIGLPVYSSLHAKGFKLSVFAKKPSISSSSLFSLRTAERAAILKHWSCYVDFNDHYQQLSMFNDCVQRIRRPLPHATTITKGGKYSYSTLYIRCLVAIWVGVPGVRVIEREYFLIVTYWSSVGVWLFEPEYFLIVTQQDLRWSASTSCSWVSSLRVCIQREFIRFGVATCSLQFVAMSNLIKVCPACCSSVHARKATCDCGHVFLSPLPTPSTRPRIRNSHTITHTHTHTPRTNQIQYKHNLSLCSSLWQIFFVYF